MTAMTRGPLSPRVYWTRRVLALVVLLGLVVAALQLVSLAGGGSNDEPDRAAPVAAEADPSATPEAAETEPPQKKQRKKRGKKNGKQRDRGPVLAEPEGECNDRDIAVTPTLDEAVGGRPVAFVLELRTIASAACTWEVSPRSLTVKVTSGKDGIWFSTQCRRAIPTRDVVVRNNVSTAVEVTWSAKRSNADCSTRYTDWALPGWYHVEAAALAGEPSDLQFQLLAPKPDVITETVAPEPKQDGKKNGKKQRVGTRRTSRRRRTPSLREDMSPASAERLGDGQPRRSHVVGGHQTFSWTTVPWW